MSNRQIVDLESFNTKAKGLPADENFAAYSKLAYDMIGRECGPEGRSERTFEMGMIPSLPLFIVSALSNHGIDLTKQNIQVAAEHLVDNHSILLILSPNLDAQVDALINLDEDTPLTAADLAVIESTKKVLGEALASNEQALFETESTQDDIRDALCRFFTPEENQYNDDALNQVHNTLATAIGQIVQRYYPNAIADINHPIWDELVNALIYEVKSLAIQGACLMAQLPAQGYEHP
jgi:hypothetical protein